MRPTRVALTGGIATGKSWVLRRLASHGLPTIDADRLARDALAPGTEGARAAVSRFGAGILDPGGAIDRSALGRIVFHDAAARADLEALVHPRVYAAIAAWFAALPPSTRAAVADIPLLFETGHADDFDLVVVTACDPATQQRRLVERDGLSVDEARARIASQWPIAEKIRRADAVIRTDGSHDETNAQVDALVASLSV